MRLTSVEKNSNMVQFNKSKQNIGACLRNCLAGLLFLLAYNAFAGPGTPEAEGVFCNANTDGSSISYDYTNAEGVLTSANIIGVPPPATPVPLLFIGSTTEMPFDYVSFRSSPPAIGDLAPALDASISREPTLVSESSTIVYLVAGGGSGGESCAFSYRLTFDGEEYTRSQFTAFDRSGLDNAKSLPFQGSFALFLTILSLVYFGGKWGSSFKDR